MDFPVLVLGWQRAPRGTECICICVCVFNEKKSENEERKGQRALTGDGESVVSDLRRDVDASPPLCVIGTAQARDIGDTSLVDVHHTV